MDPIDSVLFTARVPADIAEKDEHRLYRQPLQEVILPLADMAGLAFKTILQAREAALALLKASSVRLRIE